LDVVIAVGMEGHDEIGGVVVKSIILRDGEEKIC
jgi:hypothetical protein